MNSPSQIPANPDLAVSMMQDGANAIPDVNATQGVAVPESAPVPQQGDSDKIAADFWGALEKESDELANPEAAPQLDQQTISLEPTVQQPAAPVDVTQMQPGTPAQQYAPQAPAAPAQAVAPEIQTQLDGIQESIGTIQQQVQPQIDPAQIANQAVQYLSQNDYKLSSEQAESLITEPETVLPVMAAQIHVALAQSLGQQVQQQISQMVPEMIRSQSAASEAESTFYGKYPGLRNPQYEKVVTDSIRLVKQLNPQANRTQVMDLAASAAAQTLRQAGHPNALGTQPMQQAQQQGAFPQANPYAPAAATVAGAGQLPNVPQPQQNIWGALAEADDSGVW